MTKKERMELVDWNDTELSISEQAKLLGINRSSLYYKPVLTSAEEVAVKHHIDEIRNIHPYKSVWTQKDGH